MGLSLSLIKSRKNSVVYWLGTDKQKKYRRKSCDAETAKEPNKEADTVPVEQVKCLVLKDDVDDEESLEGKEDEAGENE